jgi:N-acetyl-anhydromuramyl-L-alanine amidase AmpD
VKEEEQVIAFISRDWLPRYSMKRIICHWTTGAYKASSIDRAHYHILIEQDGTLIRGTHSIEDNVSTKDGGYAAHTLKLNTGSIGLAVCCMANVAEKPFDPGPFPMTQKQWRTMAQVAAELCQFYGIPVTPQTVLGHGEVERHLGIDQARKWDPSEDLSGGPQ